MARVPADATAFAHRTKRVLVNVAAFYRDVSTRDAHREWAHSFARSLQPDDDAAYVGFLAGDEVERLRATYPGATWERLARVKATYDPENVFRLNHNVPPEAAPERRTAAGA
jgi:FAD/FMN-containing dehydrogenase